MFKNVKVGEKEIPMEANAFSPYVYRQIFHEDFLIEIQKTQPAPDLFQKMGYVMAKQAETKSISELMKLNIEGFYEWLCQFDAFELILATDAISELYTAQNKSLSVPKKEGE